MSLKDLYCLAYAPLQGTGLSNVNEMDSVLENIIKEVKFLKTFNACAFENFLNCLESKQRIEKNKSKECAVALCCLVEFLQRMQDVYKGACELTSATLNNDYPDISKPMKDLMVHTQTPGFSPTDSRLDSYLVTEANSQWKVPPVIRGKVEFRKSVSIIRQNESSAKGLEVCHTAMKEDFSRKKCRKATGYAKFNFKDLEKDQEKLRENEKDEDLSNNNNNLTSSSISVNKNSSEQNLSVSDGEKNEKKEENVINAQYFSVMKICCFNRNNESTNKNMNQSIYSDSNSFCRSCCVSDFVEDEINENVLRYESSVILGNVEEIQDPDVDKNWHDNSRHKERFARIRNRKPTGHPNLLNSASDDLGDLLDNSEDV